MSGETLHLLTERFTSELGGLLPETRLVRKLENPVQCHVQIAIPDGEPLEWSQRIKPAAASLASFIKRKHLTVFSTVSSPSNLPFHIAKTTGVCVRGIMAYLPEFSEYRPATVLRFDVLGEKRK